MRSLPAESESDRGLPAIYAKTTTGATGQRVRSPIGTKGVTMKPGDIAAIVKWKWRGLAEIRKVFRNWPQVTLFRLGFTNHVFAEWRSGGSTVVESQEEWARLKLRYLWCVELLKAYGHRASVMNGEIQFTFHNQLLRFKIDPMLEAYSVLLEQFVYEDYKWLRVEGKQVLDVGASIGDSAVYFAVRGAAQVYALEPYPYAYRFAETNIKLNALERQITLLNVGCGKEGTITVNPELKNDPSSELVACETGEKVRILSLKRLVESFGLNDAVAKIDCEGCEYEVILGAADRELRTFSQMIIEYHREFSRLMDRMESAGFRVVRTAHFHLKDSSTGGSREVGFIKAERLPK